MLELTITQIAARLGVSERTAHRYLAAGKFHTEPGRKGRYLVDPDELDRLAASDPDEVAKLAAAVEALTRRVEVLESQAQPRPVRQRINIPGNIDQAQARVGEMVSARQFVQLHGLTKDRLATWLNNGEIQATPVARGQGQVSMLNQAQQAGAVAFWERAGIVYQRCHDCPHISHAGGDSPQV